jgi:amidase
VVGLGTDTCGSIRVPAADTNLYGLRPTSGLSSRSGVIPLSWTLDTVGPMARTVIDLAIVLDATAGVDPDDPTTVPLQASFLESVDPQGLRGRRIGVLNWGAPNPAASEVVEAALEQMAANGAELVPVTDLDVTGADGAFTLIDEFRFALDEYLAAHPQAPVETVQEVLDGELRLDPGVRERLSVATLDTPAYQAALDNREPLRNRIVAFMDAHQLDALAYPTTDLRCAAASLAGLPALVVPAGFTSRGGPVGLELLGRAFDEATLIRIAAGYEAATHHRMLPASTPPLDSAQGPRSHAGATAPWTGT